MQTKYFLNERICDDQNIEELNMSILRCIQMKLLIFNPLVPEFFFS